MSTSAEEILHLSQAVAQFGRELNNSPGGGSAEIYFPELYKQHQEVSLEPVPIYIPPYRIESGVSVGKVAEFKRIEDHDIIVKGSVMVLGESCESEPQLRIRMPQVKRLGRKIGVLSMDVYFDDRVHPSFAGVGVNVYDSGNLEVDESTDMELISTDPLFPEDSPLDACLLAVIHTMGLDPIFRKVPVEDSREGYKKVLEAGEALVVLRQFKKLIAKDHRLQRAWRQV